MPTEEVLGSRGLRLDTICNLCHQSMETIDHLLRGCGFARDFWQQLQFPICMTETFNLPIGKWLEVNCKANIKYNRMGIPWKILFPMGVWHVWLHRNNFIFKTGKVDRSCFKKSIKDSVEFFFVGLNAKLPKAKSVVAVGWDKPPMGWAKLNSDRSALGNPGRTGGGGVIRDHDGKWLKGYAQPLGSTNSCMDELWALRDGLLLAKDMGLNNLIIELDALSVVLLMNNNTPNLTLEPLLNDCRNLVREIPDKQIMLIFREANQFADAMAKLGVSCATSFVVFLYPPLVVERILVDDKASLRCNRLINS